MELNSSVKELVLIIIDEHFSLTCIHKMDLEYAVPVTESKSLPI